jgi:hypothetical protein
MSDASIYRKIERFEYKDPVLGLVGLKEKNGEWVSEHGLKITAEKGKIVTTIKTGEGDNSRSIVRRFEASSKMDSFDIKDPRAKIDVKIKVSEEEKLMAQLMKQVKDEVKEPMYKNHKMKPEQGAWVWRKPGKGWIIIDVITDDREVGVVAVESSIHNSVERVDTKTFSLSNKLLIFDSATEHGETPRINVKNEEGVMGEILSRSNVNLRKQALEQQLDEQEFQKLGNVIKSGFSLMK